MRAPDRERGTAQVGAFRLAGDVGGRRRSFLLHPGQNQVGSSPESDVVLPVPGVSRCHALLQVEASGLDVRDAGSKNGTFLDGRRMGAGPVAPGDLLRFGPVELVVERLAPGDATLAIPAPGSSAPPAPVAAPAEDAATAHLPAFDPATLQRWLAALEIALREPRPGASATVGSRLGEIAGELGAHSAALFDLAGPPGARARVRGAWGEPFGDGPWSVLETAAQDLRRTGAAREFAPWIGASPGALLLERAARGEVRGIVFGGRFRAHEESQSLLRMLLRILLPPAGPGEEAEPPRAGRHGASPALCFPSGYLAGHAPAMRALFQQLAGLRGSSGPVLVTGETGTGKEPIARTLHESSQPGRDRSGARAHLRLVRGILHWRLGRLPRGLPWEPRRAGERRLPE